MLVSKFAYALRAGAVGLALTLAAPAAGLAAPITFTGQGTVGSVDMALSAFFSVGDTLTYSYTFESTTVARIGSDSNFAVFDALTGMSLSIGGFSASSSSALEIQVDNDPGMGNHDRYATVSRGTDGLTGMGAGAFIVDFFGTRLDDSSDTVFSDALILPTAIDLNDFDSRIFFLFFTDPAGGLHVVDGTLTALAPIPEPGTLGIAAVGLAALGLMRRRQKV